MTQTFPESHPTEPATTKPLPPLEDPVERLVLPAKGGSNCTLSGYGPVIRVLEIRDFKVKYKQSLSVPCGWSSSRSRSSPGFVVGFRGLSHVETAGIPYVVFTLAGAERMGVLPGGDDHRAPSSIRNNAASCASRRARAWRSRPRRSSRRCRHSRSPLSAALSPHGLTGTFRCRSCCCRSRCGWCPHPRHRVDRLVARGPLPRHHQRAAVLPPGRRVPRAGRLPARRPFPVHAQGRGTQPA